MNRVHHAINLSRRRSSAYRSKQNHDFARGLSYAKASKWHDAIECFEKALALAPAPEDQLPILLSLADAAQQLGMTDAAIEFYSRARLIDSQNVPAIVGLANLQAKKGQCIVSQNLLSDALAGNPTSPELWMTLGNVTRQSGDLEKSEQFLREAVRLKPSYALAIGSLADTLWDMAKDEAALETYSQALKRAPGNAQIRYHRAIVNLVLGNLKDGWRDFDARFKANPSIVYEHGLKAWNGKAQEKRILITGEQGIGDQIMFASLLVDLKKGGDPQPTFIVECEPRLVDLFKRSFPELSFYPMKVVESGGCKTIKYEWLEQAGGADYALPIGSLGAIHRTSLDDFPNPNAYLKPNSDEAKEWEQWLSSLGTRSKVGLCWRSGNTGGTRAVQYAPEEAWCAFAKELDADLICLQYDASQEEIDRLAAMIGRPIAWPPVLDQKNEIDRTIALMANLDIVVSAPTAVAAMSAGVGTPTIKMIYDRIWTALGQSYEPFAPACRIVRADTPGDWAQAFEKAANLYRSLMQV